MMSFADIPADRMPDDRYDPGIYSNAILYVGDILHDDFLIERAEDNRERAALLLAALDRLWGQFFRWITVAELEAWVEQRVRSGAPPGGSEISQKYLELLREYCGHAEGVVAVDDLFAAEWMNNQVSFLSYEQQFWPPAMAAACMLAERLRAGDPDARRGVDGLLGRGELDLTYPLLLGVGIDMASAAPYGAVARRMDALLDRLEATLDAGP
jgi:oligoendopeptidase F